MSQQIPPSQLRTVNNRLTTELGKIMYDRPDLFRNSPTLQQSLIDCCKACSAYMSWYMLTAFLHLAKMTPALAEQLNHVREIVRGER